MSNQRGPRASRVNVLIVDDHEKVRKSTREMLEKYERFTVVGEASDGLMAVDQACLLSPSIVLMDVRMPGEMDGLTATHLISTRMPRLPVLILTSHEQPDYFLEAMRAGAAGYVLKESTAAQIVATIDAVLAGDSPISPDLAMRLLRRIAAEGPPHPPIHRRIVDDVPHPSTDFDLGETWSSSGFALSVREVEVLQLLTTGKTNGAIAQSLHLSPHTVKNYVETIFKKLDVPDRTQAAVKAVRLGLPVA